MSRINANTTMPRISAPTPRLFTIDRSRIPNALITVVVIRVTSAMNTLIVNAGIGEGEARSKPKMLESTSGTVIATAVVVSTPAQK